MILTQVLLASALLVLTTTIHAAGMAVSFRWLKLLHTKRLETVSMWIRSLAVGVLVLVMFVATLIETSVWAMTYIVLGAISTFEEALYFSMVTYSTLGYGDVVLGEQWRLLSSFQAANGILMFGWTVSLIILAVHQISKTLKELGVVNRGWQKQGDK